MGGFKNGGGVNQQCRTGRVGVILLPPSKGCPTLVSKTKGRDVTYGSFRRLGRLIQTIPYPP